MAAVSSRCPTASRWFIGLRSFCKQLEIRYQQSIGTPSSLETGACSLTDLTPAIYFDAPPLTSIGGLLSYGNDPIDNFRRAAVYVDRILRGAKPSDLPVQNPVKYEMTINLKTAKVLGL